MRLITKMMVVICSWVLLPQLTNAQPESIEYEKPYDFFCDVLWNPDARLFDFLIAGLNSKTAELHYYHEYAEDKTVRARCKELKVDLYESYKKVEASWKVLKEVEKTDFESFTTYMITYHRDDIFAPKKCPNPELQHKLSIVPLRLKKY